jgi:hypothetical protein
MSSVPRVVIGIFLMAGLLTNAYAQDKLKDAFMIGAGKINV